MSLYDLPEFKLPAKNKLPKNLKKIRLSGKKIAKTSFRKNRSFWFMILNILIPALFGFFAGALSGGYFYFEVKDYLDKFNRSGLGETSIIAEEARESSYFPRTLQEESVIRVVEEVSPSVVSIVISKITEKDHYDLWETNSTKEEIGSGTGFIISSDGMVLTNKHVVTDEKADYAVLASDGQEFSAEVLARDPFKDLAVLKIITDRTDFQPVKLGDSDKLQIGQSVISIGNALGEYNNTISVGIVSGLGRKIVASGGGLTEKLENLIQTDAAINRGNSGGPLLNLAGEVIGVSVAMSQTAENIGFAIPVNDARRDIEMIKEKGEIIYPFLGIRYVIITSDIQQEDDLPIDYGALIIRGDNLGEAAVTPGSAAEAAGLKEGDIVLEFAGEKITSDNPLAKIIQKYNPGDKIILKILRNNEEEIIEVVLGERNS